jgi:hypothetical protein
MNRDTVNWLFAVTALVPLLMYTLDKPGWLCGATLIFIAVVYSVWATKKLPPEVKRLEMDDNIDAAFKGLSTCLKGMEAALNNQSQEMSNEIRLLSNLIARDYRNPVSQDDYQGQGPQPRDEAVPRHMKRKKKRQERSGPPATV